jgi:tight adherence protein C
VAALLIMLLAMSAGGSIIWYQLQRERRLTGRLQALRQLNNFTASPIGHISGEGITGLVAALGFGIARSGLLSQSTIEGLKQTLASAGLRGPGVMGLFVGAKILLMLLMPLLALLLMQYLDVSPVFRNTAIAGSALVGLLAPNWWIGQRHKRYLRAVAVGLPDALDMMVICSEAGLSFEPTIARVAHEIHSAHPVIAEEFIQTVNELRVVADSKVALANMGARTGVDGIKRMTSVLVQTMRYGTPLSDALRVLSAEMRQETLIRHETRAARLPVLLTIPMILFILPCIFLIVGGPAVVQVMNSK